MGFSILKTRMAQETLGRLLAGYLRLVRRTNRIAFEPADIYDHVRPELPLIFAMWHGQHIMIPFARPEWMPACSLVSRHGDGGFNAVALRELGIGAIRGSGALGRKIREKGGASAFLAMMRRLAAGDTMVLTADVPKRARIVGPGIIALARASGRPIRAVAVVTSRRIDFKSWDRASIGLPFGRCAIVVGEPILVARDADEATQEAARLELQASLDDVHARGYALVGSRDPGAGLREQPA
ncbi:lysophospholipid acyltransferase family protein [Bosea sp. (in: a-proteobacteria)]|uniref:lysophospholipid acyltransferase family protein n=1 Tax=Bosea sp. (in: a-proteobacteria) TaxID=1871050 RepID=UPI0026390C76|nr:lysophospholipid acyltransferase family protein [Bosea sp. (in: a-proteobacteria)]MCO5092314.1 lysophospholipid acyltransferase family protein [Bosea sp. (in: a-proteobacteria)]